MCITSLKGNLHLIHSLISANKKLNKFFSVGFLSLILLNLAVFSLHLSEKGWAT